MRKALVCAMVFACLGAFGANAADRSPWLPDPVRTPGATNPSITQDNIHQTICNHGHWSTKSIRPPASYTNRLKKRQIAQYGYEDTDPHLYEEDHLIPLTIGGNPRDPKNLWPQPWDGEWGAHVKDKLENALNKLVCSGRLTLKAAQECISSDWVACYRKHVGSAEAEAGK